MGWKFTQDRPVYLQIAERIIRSVLSGEYLPGEQIPAVRALALDAAVNPNTVQHAFNKLESEGVIISKGTLGRFVTENKETIEQCRKSMAEQAVTNFIQSMSELSITREQAIKLIEEVTE